MEVEKPLVSVLMTAYNREKFIAEAIESVLSSTYKEFELLIVDDGSKDKTVEIANAYAAKDERINVFVNEQNLGDYPNRNKAASYAKGKYIKYLDADDIIYPHGLEVMVNSMEKFPDAGFGLSSKGDSENPYPKIIQPRQIYWEHFNGFGHFYRAPGSSIINLPKFRQIGGFTGKRMIGDFEFWLLIAQEHPMVKMPTDLYWARKHEEQESNSEYAKQYPILYAQVLKELVFENPKCPLPQEQLTSLYKNFKKRTAVSILKNMLRYIILK